MGKTVDNPKRFIISCRVSDKELQVLQEQAKLSGTNLSELLRQSLNLDDSYPMHNGGLCS